MLTIRTRSVTDTDYDRYFVMVENQNSSPVVRELDNYSLAEIKRGRSIVGDEVNIHLIALNTFGGQHSLNIRSYSDVPVGETILLGRDNILQKKSGSTVNLEFADVPDFDVVTRSAQFQQHCYTQATLLDVPDADVGGNTFPASQNFYVCLEKNGEAGFILQKIPLVQPSFVISLDSLNSHTSKYELPETIGSIPINTIMVTANAQHLGPIGIYNLSDFSIFPSGKADLFVPTEGMNIENFNIDYRLGTHALSYESYYTSDSIITHPSLINASVDFGSVLNRELDFTTAGDFDFIKIRISADGSTWYFYGPGSKGMYVPDLPPGLTSVTGEPDFMDSADTATFQLYDYSEVGGYQESLSVLLNDSINFMSGANESYTLATLPVPYNNQK